MRKSSKPQGQTPLPIPRAYYEFSGNAYDIVGNINGVIDGGVFIADRNGTADSAFYNLGNGKITGLKCVLGTLSRTYILMLKCYATANLFENLFSAGKSDSFLLTAYKKSDTKYVIRNKMGITIYDSSTQINYGDYVHVALTYGSGIGKLYINGMVSRSVSVVGVNTDIGGGIVGAIGVSNLADAVYDYLAVYDSVLSENEILRIYNRGVPYPV